MKYTTILLGFLLTLSLGWAFADPVSIVLQGEDYQLSMSQVSSSATEEVVTAIVTQQDSSIGQIHVVLRYETISQIIDHGTWEEVTVSRGDHLSTRVSFVYEIVPMAFQVISVDSVYTEALDGSQDIPEIVSNVWTYVDSVRGTLPKMRITSE
jgi:hypothetical protein